MDSGASGHRKIELQFPEDFTYLLNNVRRAAAESISAAFPVVEGVEDEEDKLRVRIEEFINDYIAQTFTLAAPNISINGLPVPDSLLPKTTAEAAAAAAAAAVAKNPQKKSSKKKTAAAATVQQQQQKPEEPEEEIVYEPFKSRLRDRIPDLLREEEDLLREIASLKRRVPGQAAARITEVLKDGLERDEAMLEVARADAVEWGLKGRVLLDLGGGGENGVVERPEEVRSAFGAAVDGLGRLKREMPAAVARMERARAAGSYVVTGR